MNSQDVVFLTVPSVMVHSLKAKTLPLLVVAIQPLKKVFI